MAALTSLDPVIRGLEIPVELEVSLTRLSWKGQLFFTPSSPCHPHQKESDVSRTFFVVVMTFPSVREHWSPEFESKGS